MLASYKVLKVFQNRASFLVSKRGVIINCISFILFLALIILGLSSGSDWISPLDSLREVLGLGNGDFTFTIKVLRLPRILVAILSGGALGISGLILQSIIKNPLASPDVIGVTGGAKLATVITLTNFSNIPYHFVPFIAISGAFLSSLLIYLTSWKRGISPTRLILVGIGFEAVIGALVTLFIVYSSVYSTSEAYIWIVGSVYGSQWTHVKSLLPWILVLLPLSLFFTRKITVQDLPDDLATSIGVSISKDRLLLSIVSIGLAGSAIAFAGGISFVGLLAPHIAKKMISRTYGSLILLSFFIGGALVLFSDIIARTLFLPLDIPAGVFISAIGAPFFIYLLLKEKV